MDIHHHHHLDHSDIAVAAYYLYERRIKHHELGTALEDWYRAERQLRHER